jgi:hypothetical protein
MGRLDEADAKVSAELGGAQFRGNECLLGNSLN